MDPAAGALLGRFLVLLFLFVVFIFRDDIFATGARPEFRAAARAPPPERPTRCRNLV